MKLAELRALPIGARLGLSPRPYAQVLYAGLAGEGRDARARVVGIFGDAEDVSPRRLARVQPVAYLDVFMERPGLTGHTITIERIAGATWSKLGVRRGCVGDLAVIERNGGTFIKVCALHSDLWGGSIEQAARSYASGYGARYVPAGGEV